MKFGVAGAGFSGAVVARQLADAGHRVVVHEARSHVAGNCHTTRHQGTGVMVHRYGPHIFHTGEARVWEFVCRFGEMVPYEHRVRTTVGGRVYSLPINLHTINQFFDRALSPDEARRFIADRADRTIGEPANFEEQALKFVGRELYEAFLAGYTRKQWGVDPVEIPASVLKRLPVRFSYDDSYFDHPHQAIPRDGYTALVERILDHPCIEVRLSTPVDAGLAAEFEHTVWTGSLDAWFDHRFGRLRYRTLDFEEIVATGDFQGCAVMNVGDDSVPYTRTTEFAHLTPWESHAQTVCLRERSRLAEADDIAYYPLRLAADMRVLEAYRRAAGEERRVSFVGRLGTYRYIDMDVAIGEALRATDGILAAVAAGTAIPPFFVEP